ncbi:hypothetical protein DQE82_10525 [Micromonospora sp. LHW51205]|nr:hypothetical protein DQE82_10525 [Micromonospora sp. LHW51205]
MRPARPVPSPGRRRPGAAGDRPAAPATAPAAPTCARPAVPTCARPAALATAGHGSRGGRRHPAVTDWARDGALRWAAGWRRTAASGTAAAPAAPRVGAAVRPAGACPSRDGAAAR